MNGGRPIAPAPALAPLLALVILVAPALSAPTPDQDLDSTPFLAKARALLDQGRWAQALGPLRLAVSRARAQLGRSHRRTTGPLLALGEHEARMALYPEARFHLEEALRIREGTTLPDEPARVEGWVAFGRLLVELGEHGLAEDLLRPALRVREHQLGPGDPAAAEVRLLLARLWAEQGRIVEAEDALDLELALARRLEPPPARRLAEALVERAAVGLARARGERDGVLAARPGPVLRGIRPDPAAEAAGYATEALRLWPRPAGGKVAPARLRLLTVAAWTAFEAGNGAEAARRAAEAEALAEVFPAPHPAGAPLALLAAARALGRGRPDLADARIAKARSLLRPHPLGTGHPLTREADRLQARIWAAEAARHPDPAVRAELRDEAVTLLRRAEQGARKQTGDPWTGQARACRHERNELARLRDPAPPGLSAFPLHLAREPGTTACPCMGRYRPPAGKGD